MSTESQEYDAREGGARIEDLPAADSQLAREEREKPSPQRAPPEQWEPREPEDARRGSPPPGDLEDAARRSPSPGGPEPDE